MAQKALDQEILTCAICLAVLKDPVTIPCGHSYCRRCVQGHWDEEEGKPHYSCPECRERFSPRPALVKNIKIAALVEHMKKMGLTAPPVEACEAGPGDVSCDVCSGQKLKAVRSCLQCVASYCQTHLQPHYDAAALQKHQLVAPSSSLQEYLCSEHSEVKKIFCRTDQQLLCVVCCMDQHKDHDTVSSAAERAQRQGTLEKDKNQLVVTLSDRETDLERLRQEGLSIIFSTHGAVKRSGDSFTDMILLLEKKRSEVEQQIRVQENLQLSQVQVLEDQVELDISDLKRTISEMDTLLNTPDHNHFLQLFSKLPKDRSSAAVSRVAPEELSYFDSVTTAVTALKEKLRLSLTLGLAEVSTALSEVDTLLPSRERFLIYACDVTLDPNTVNNHLQLSEGNRRATFNSKPQSYPQHPDRFTVWQQVLSREALTGRCYWEVEMIGQYGIRLAVAYKDIDKTYGGFGTNDNSWALVWTSKNYSFLSNNINSYVSGPLSSRLGVFLDHSAGLLSFYSISDQTLTLLHRVKTTFTRPLHVGVWIYKDEHTVCFPQIKELLVL